MNTNIVKVLYKKEITAKSTWKKQKIYSKMTLVYISEYISNCIKSKSTKNTLKEMETNMNHLPFTRNMFKI